MLATSIFSFSHNVFYPSEKEHLLLNCIYFIVCECFEFGQVSKNVFWSRVKEFEADNFRFDEDGTKFSKRVENTVGKGEIARYERFLFFPQSFQKNYTADT